MRKELLTAIFAFAAVFAAEAQVSKNAIGVRLGDNDGLGTEISYQRKLSKNNRLEANLGWSGSEVYDAFKATGIYQWHWNLEGNFVWYAGVGGSVGAWSTKYNNSGSHLAVAGQIGVEYHLNIPLQIALDFKPEVNLLNNNYYNRFGRDIALSVRYKF